MGYFFLGFVKGWQLSAALESIFKKSYARTFIKKIKKIIKANETHNLNLATKKQQKYEHKYLVFEEGEKHSHKKHIRTGRLTLTFYSSVVVCNIRFFFFFIKT